MTDKIEHDKPDAITALRAENERLRGELADFRRFVKEQFGYEDALEKETSE